MTTGETPPADQLTGARLHPYFRQAWAPLYKITQPIVADGNPRLSTHDLEHVRRAFTPATTYQPPHINVAERVISTPSGGVTVRIYSPPRDVAPCSGVVWAHGGGFVCGDLDMPESDRTCRELAARLPAVVVSVAYQLAGAVHFPVPSDDLLAALEWTHRQHHMLRIDPEKLIVAGVSAGGNIAAGVALRARDNGGPRLAGLLLLYPSLHRDQPPGSSEARRAADELPPPVRFTAERVHSMYDSYLGPQPQQVTASPYAIPGIANLHGLPPTVIVLAECDGLRPSGEAFAANLAKEGVSVETYIAPRTPHGFLNFIGCIDEATTPLDWITKAICRFLKLSIHRYSDREMAQ